MTLAVVQDISFIKVIVLAIIQGLAELLPVSSSAHVIVAEKLMGIDPSSPDATLLLVMLHTGTMFAVIVYFWKAWQKAFFSSMEQFKESAIRIIVATVVTGVIGLGLKKVIEEILKHQNKGMGKAELEQLFKHLNIVSIALFAAGVLILLAGLKKKRPQEAHKAAPQQAANSNTLNYETTPMGGERENVTMTDAIVIGATQGLCLPFRGFSRSGATISVGLLRNLARIRSEEYSFALAVVLTPPVIGYEVLRLFKHAKEAGEKVAFTHFTPSLIGMVASFLAGLVALKILSKLLEHGRWWVFGIYCMIFATIVMVMHIQGY